MSENDLKLPPKLLAAHLRCRARAMRECGSRLAPDFDCAADCIDDLRLGNSSRAELHEIKYYVDRALESIRAGRTSGSQLVRAVGYLNELAQYLEDKLAPVDDDEDDGYTWSPSSL